MVDLFPWKPKSHPRALTDRHKFRLGSARCVIAVAKTILWDLYGMMCERVCVNVAVDKCAGLTCYFCTIQPPSGRTNLTARLCSMFDYSTHFYMDCPYSTFCVKRTYEMTLQQGSKFTHSWFLLINSTTYSWMNLAFAIFRTWRQLKLVILNNSVTNAG